jgi:IPT/TIG domain
MAATTLSQSPGTTPPAEPVLNLQGGDAAWFVGGIFGVMLLAAVAVVLANGSLNKSAQKVIDQIVNQTEGKGEADATAGGVQALAVGDRLRLLDAIRGQVSVRGASRGATRAAIALMIITLAALALAATLISGAPDAPSLRNTIISALLAVLATVAGFYFGAKTAEDSHTSTSAATTASQGSADSKGSADGNVSPGGGGPQGQAMVASAPQVTDLVPQSGTENATVTITGSGLEKTEEVRFGRVIADIVTSTETSVQVKVPAAQSGADEVAVVVKTPDGLSDADKGPKFTYNP